MSFLDAPQVECPPVIINSSSRSALSHIEGAALLEALRRPLLVLDADGCVTFASAHALRLLGVSIHRLRGRPFHHLFEEGPQLRAAVQQMLRDLPSRSSRLTLAKAGETDRQLHIRLTAIDDPDTTPHVLVHIRLQRTSRRSPTRERVMQKLPENSPTRIFAP